VKNKNQRKGEIFMKIPTTTIKDVLIQAAKSLVYLIPDIYRYIKKRRGK
jgi:hypothetical protein